MSAVTCHAHAIHIAEGAPVEPMVLKHSDDQLLCRTKIILQTTIAEAIVSVLSQGTLTRWVEGPRKPHKRHPQGTRSPTTPFNHVHCRDVGAKAGSVHLLYWKLDRKGGVRTHLQQHHVVAQECPSPRNYNWPPEVHKQCHYYNPAPIMTSTTFHHTPDTAHFLCGWSRQHLLQMDHKLTELAWKTPARPMGEEVKDEI